MNRSDRVKFFAFLLSYSGWLGNVICAVANAVNTFCAFLLVANAVFVMVQKYVRASWKEEGLKPLRNVGVGTSTVNQNRSWQCKVGFFIRTVCLYVKLRQWHVWLCTYFLE